MTGDSAAFVLVLGDSALIALLLFWAVETYAPRVLDWIGKQVMR